MSEKSHETKETGRSNVKVVTGAAKRLAFNLIPGYPILGVIRSFKETTKPGAVVIMDLAKRLPQEKRSGRVRSWNEAMAARPLDALPLQEIERSNTRSKQVFLAFMFLSLCALLGNAISGSVIGVISDIMFAALCTMQMFKFELRLRQMETGPLNADAPLMSPREFLRAPRFLTHLFNWRIEWK